MTRGINFKTVIIICLAAFMLTLSTLVTYALWRENLVSYDEDTNSGGIWNESAKYFVFSEIFDGGVVTAYAVSAYEGLIDCAEIPEEYLNKPVTAIKGTFVNNTLIKEIIIPQTVTLIEGNAFLNFTRLKKVTVTGTQKNLVIEGFAFVNCSSLVTFIYDPNRILSVADTAFFNTNGITKPSA